MADAPPSEPSSSVSESSPSASPSAQTSEPSPQMPSLDDISFELPPDASGDPSLAGNIDQAAIDELLKQAQFDDVAAVSGDMASEATADPTGPAVNAQRLELTQFQQVMQDAQVSSIDLLRDVELNVKIELGRSRMLVEDVLKLGEGSVVELDKLAGDPVDVFVNDRLVARGEVLVLNDNFCVRVNEIVAGLKEEAV
jgi:flagellar motor switch protein FliN/FliY